MIVKIIDGLGVPVSSALSCTATNKQCPQIPVLFYSLPWWRSPRGSAWMARSCGRLAAAWRAALHRHGAVSWSHQRCRGHRHCDRSWVPRRKEQVVRAAMQSEVLQISSNWHPPDRGINRLSSGPACQYMQTMWIAVTSSVWLLQEIQIGLPNFSPLQESTSLQLPPPQQEAASI